MDDYLENRLDDSRRNPNLILFPEDDEHCDPKKHNIDLCHEYGREKCPKTCHYAQGREQKVQPKGN